MIVPNTELAGAINNKKTFALFTDCISEINNTEIDNAKYVDVVMPMYNFIEYDDNYSKTSGSLWQHCRGEPASNNNGTAVNIYKTLCSSCNLINSV